MNDNVRLLVFAHRGEARAVLKHYEMKLLTEIPLQLYQSADKLHYLLITGEGSLEALAKTSAALGYLNHHLTEVINLGIAGSLHPTVLKDQLICARTVYAQQSEQKMYFKSYTLENGEYDVVTAYDRVLDLRQGEYLSAFAPIVDRELWAIAQACSTFHKPLRAYKYISDEIWSQNEGQFCQQIKENSQIYSEALLECYLKSQSALPEPSSTSEDEFYDIPGMYFSVSMKRKMDSLLLSLKKAGEYLPFMKAAYDLIEEKKYQKSRPKEIAQSCLLLAQKILSPFDHKVDEALKKIALPFSKNGIEIIFDAQRETPSFLLRTQVNHSKQLEKLKAALEVFEFDEVEKIYQGQIDV